MADSSGNLKMLVGAGLGALVTAGIALSLANKPAPVPAPKPSPAVAVQSSAKAKLPAVAPQAPPAVPTPRAASETEDWRGRVEVGETAEPVPTPGRVPKTPSEIAQFLKDIAAGSGGRDKLLPLVNGRYSVNIRGYPVQLDVFGVKGVVLHAPTLHLDAVWRPDGCTQRLRGGLMPCEGHVMDLAEAVFVSHALTVIAPTQPKTLRPRRVESGQTKSSSWISITFSVPGTKASLVGLFDTRRMRLSYGELAWTDKQQAAYGKRQKSATAKNLSLPSHAQAIIDGWRTYGAGPRLPGGWCLPKQHGRPAVGQPLTDCLRRAQVADVQPAPVAGTVALPKAVAKVSVGSASASRLAAVRIPLTGGKMDATGADAAVQSLDKKVAAAELDPWRSGVLLVRGQQLFYAVAVSRGYTGPVVGALSQGTTTASAAQGIVGGDVLAAVADFEKRVIAAGFQPTAGPRLVAPIPGESPAFGEMKKIFVEIPIAPPPSVKP